MNYRHSFHAGNFADVFKHILLIALVKSFFRKETPFCYLDTHAGIGRYDLTLQKNKEYKNGIEKIMAAGDAPFLVEEYKQLCNISSLYPGSPEIVKNLIRPQDRIILCEMHQEDFQVLKKNYSHQKHIAIHHLDGYQGLKAFLPPKEKRGLILIDPPYENANEFSQIIASLSQALKRFETGIYAIWYPIKHYQSIIVFHRELKKIISRPTLICELNIYSPDIATQLNGSGMIIVNPPFQLKEQLQGILPWLFSTLRMQNQGNFEIKIP